ncbi:MAG: C40 family peptidase [Bacteroidales bacterium]|nr:C40 family peptidase [Bacteroidales bacterium]
MTKPVIYLIVATLAVTTICCGSSCKTTQHTTTQQHSNVQTTSKTSQSSTNSQSAEYKKYSEKLKTQFKGTEDLAMLKEISEWIGTPYKYASAKKGVGTDCSGFVTSVYLNVYNIKLNRSSYDIINNVDVVDRSKMDFGDILFFADEKGKIYHVGIYLGNNNFVHSATSNNVGVKIDNLNSTYYKQHFYKAGHVKGLKK